MIFLFEIGGPGVLISTLLEGSSEIGFSGVAADYYTSLTTTYLLLEVAYFFPPKNLDTISLVKFIYLFYN